MSLQAIIHIKNMCSHEFSDKTAYKLKRNKKDNYGRCNSYLFELFGNTSDE